MANSEASQETWEQTASSVEAIIKEIDDGELSSTKEGRAFLAGAAVSLRAGAAEFQLSDKPEGEAPLGA